MKKRFNLGLQLVLILVLLNSCQEYNPWDSQDSVPFKAPPEIPTEITNSNYIYITHNVTLSNKEMRNYTMCFDKTTYAARWVAYPLHSCYLGASDRSEAWAYDPNFTTSYQAPPRTYGGGWTRGHQIPSADRTKTLEANKQTFYMSNMTPQDYDYNSGIWLDLESRVRNSYRCNDTLYVVTGAHWENTNNTVGRYPVPTHYYKVLLRTRNGNTKKSVYGVPREDLKCIGFWISHSATGHLNSSYCKSVAEIERLTGFTFFPEVDVDKTQFNLSDWGY